MPTTQAETSQKNNHITGEAIALLASGGLDSTILLKELLRDYKFVYPFYVTNGNIWEKSEEYWLRRFLKAFDTNRLKPLTLLSIPMEDLYKNFWAVTGRKVPGPHSKTEAVYLPGKNILLIAKAAVCCVQKKIRKVALAPLKTNPFPDDKRKFFDPYERALSAGFGFPFKIVTPFLNLTKREVMQKGRALPLHLTFSCLNPKGRLHCGKCNKCEERKQAFASIQMLDPTKYVG